MDNQFNHIELFEAYFEGKLLDEDLIAFKSRLATDSKFRQEYEVYKNINLAIEELGDEQLKAQLENHHSSFLKIRALKKLIAYTLIAVCVTSLFVTLFYINRNQSSINPNSTIITTQADTNNKPIYNDPIIISPSKPDSILSIASQPSSSKKNNSTEISSRKPITAYRTPSEAMFYFQKNELHLYGFSLSNNVYILQEQNQLYLINNKLAYSIKEVNHTTLLEKVKKQFHETVINIKHPKIKVTSHRIMKEAIADSISIISNNNKKTYSYSEKVLKIHPKNMNKGELILIDEQLYLSIDEILYPLNNGKNQVLKEINKSEYKKFENQKMEMEVVQETIENHSEWENSN